MIKVISFRICPFVQHVTALLEAKDIKYDIEFISLKNKPQWFLDLSPTGQVPVLITESGTALFESDAIVEYLEEAYPPLDKTSDAEQRAIDRAWSYQATKHYLTQSSAQRSPDQQTLNERAEKLNKAFARAEQALAQRISTAQDESSIYFKGDALSQVDIAWLPLLHRAHLIERYSGYDFLARFPKMKIWQTTLIDSGLADQSVPDDFNEAFTDFYLSKSTFLGSCQQSHASACHSDCVTNHDSSTNHCC